MIPDTFSPNQAVSHRPGLGLTQETAKEGSSACPIKIEEEEDIKPVIQVSPRDSFNNVASRGKQVARSPKRTYADLNLQGPAGDGREGKQTRRFVLEATASGRGTGASSHSAEGAAFEERIANGVAAAQGNRAESTPAAADSEEPIPTVDSPGEEDSDDDEVTDEFYAARKRKKRLL